MSVETDASFWKWVAGALITAGGAVWGFFKYIDGRFEKKADRSDTDKCLKHIEDLYRNAESDRRQTRDLHDKAMERVSDGQRQIIDMLSRR